MDLFNLALGCLVGIGFGLLIRRRSRPIPPAPDDPYLIKMVVGLPDDEKDRDAILDAVQRQPSIIAPSEPKMEIYRHLGTLAEDVSFSLAAVITQAGGEIRVSEDVLSKIDERYPPQIWVSPRSPHGYVFTTKGPGRE